jgi:hypothetical protein
LASGHVIELLEGVVTYLTGVDMVLSSAQRQLMNLPFEKAKQDLMNEIKVKRSMYMKHRSALLRMIDRLRNHKRDQEVLPAFRDAVVEELL